MLFVATTFLTMLPSPNTTLSEVFDVMICPRRNYTTTSPGIALVVELQLQVLEHGLLVRRLRKTQP